MHIKQLLLLLLLPLSSLAQTIKVAVVTDDINNFWQAYDTIIKTKDSGSQYHLLKRFYLDKASAGLNALTQVRNYTAKEYIDAINNYPRFLKSIRSNTSAVSKLVPQVLADISKLEKAYPAAKPATIYFAIGVFRTNGTTQGNKILIGGEAALADKSTYIDELPEWRKPFYREADQVNNLALLCTHEYVHTQQKPLVENLLSKCLYEGVAEFISCLVTAKPSASPAIAFGKANRDTVISKFTQDLFLMSNDFNWLWGENSNELKVRDLGYFVGYEIAERYYNLSEDKTHAIKELIELDYTDEKAVGRIVDTTKLLPASLASLYKKYEESRPVVIAVSPFKNGSESVRPGLIKITVTFSEPLNGYHTGLDFGPLGEKYCPKIVSRSWSADGRSWTFEAELLPAQHYQVLISNNFRKQNGTRLKPYLLDFKTSN